MPMVFYALHMGGHRNPGIEPSSPSANEVGRGGFIATFYAVVGTPAGM